MTRHSVSNVFEDEWALRQHQPLDHQQLDKKANNLPNLIEKLLPAQSGDVLELDEVQSFVQKKSNKSWLWIGLYRRTHQVVAYAVGARGVDTCQRLKASIPQAYCHVQMAMSSFLFDGMDFIGNFW